MADVDWASTADPSAAGMDADRLERLAEHFRTRYVEPGKLAGCQLVVARGGSVAYACSLGLMDRERKRPVAPDTIWRIYSMTKPLTSIALMQRYERGDFLLTDPVSRFIPEWRDLLVEVADGDGGTRLVDPERPMNVRDALMHTTGLAGAVVPSHPLDYRYAQAIHEQRSGMTLERACALLADYPLKFHPGTRWNYGLSTDVCARLVEVLSGKRFDHYLADEVLGPLGMTDTGFVVPDEAAARFAACYAYRKGGEPSLLDDPATSAYRRQRSYLSGAGGLVSTTGDYLRFCRMLVAGGELDGRRVIGRKTLELMTGNHLPGGTDLRHLATGGFGESGFDGVGFGLGFAVNLGPQATAGVGSAGEYSWGGAASTAFFVDPAEELTAVFMTQLMPSTCYPIRSQLRSLVYQAIAD
ncbi:MAG: serine hydrolase [Actinomycetota bacterium]|jgi:CubicO group peptidase (beta-lactamase class C family)|nr:serine hydrolase [Actinomycetota bacterium]